MTLPEQTNKLLITIVNNNQLSTKDIMDFQVHEGSQSLLIKASIDLRESIIATIIETGRPIIAANSTEMTPQRPGPIVSDPTVVSFLVGLLDDGDSSVRTTACTTLSELVPPSSIQPQTNRILSAIRKNPTMDGALILLGKTDSPRALETLNTVPEISSTSSNNAIMVRARLGDSKAEEALLKAYADATTTNEKMALAPRLGYAATIKTIHLLSLEMRNPAFIYWNKRSRRSIRVAIIQGLHQAFPTEPIFWKPFYSPTDDSYYEAIEKWLVNKAGITWTQERPPFLYQEDAPTGMPPRR